MLCLLLIGIYWIITKRFIAVFYSAQAVFIMRDASSLEGIMQNICFWTSTKVGDSLLINSLSMGT